MQPQAYTPTTKILTNFAGNLTRVRYGDMDSGMVRYSTSHSYDPFSRPGVISFQETPTRIDSGASVITSMIVKMIERIESGLSYVYGIGYDGRLYKITVSTDSPALVAATSLNLKYGGGMVLFNGTTEKLYIGNDAGVSKINTDGSGSTAITAGVTWIPNVPRPGVIFLGKQYWGNDTNIVEIDSTETVSNGARLSPALPSNFHIRDLQISNDGRYMVIVASRLPASDIETVDPTDISSNVDTVVAYWNGIDNAISSFETFPSFSGIAAYTVGQSTVVSGYNFLGAIVRDPASTDNSNLLTLSLNKAPLSAAMDSTSGLTLFACPEFDTNKLSMALFAYGSLDKEVGGTFRLLKMAASSANTDIITVGALKLVSNLTYASTAGGGSRLTTARVYFSTYETGGTPTAKLYKFTISPPAGGTTYGGVYETQVEMFPNKIRVNQVKVYLEPTVTGNGFQIDLIGSNGNPISNGTFTYSFAAGSDPLTLTGALDRVGFTPKMDSTYALGLRITNTGTTPFFIHKVDIDYAPGGE